MSLTKYRRANRRSQDRAGMKEGQRTEWKESWRDDHLRAVCGFANAEGGVLVIGRIDKGRVVGIANAQALSEELPNKIRDLLGILVEVNLRREGGREYLEVVTPAYPSRHHGSHHGSQSAEGNDRRPLPSGPADGAGAEKR